MNDWVEATVAAARDGRLGVLTDVDGTVSPFAQRPDDARVDARALVALSALSSRVTVTGAVSGRDLDDLMRMVGLPDLYYSGGHGLSWRFGDLSGHTEGAEVFEGAVEPAASDLARLLAGMPVRFERKRFGLAVHYRDAPDAVAARHQVLAAVSESSAARRFSVREGARVVELTPPLRVSKGTVIRRVAEQFALTDLVFFGDDVTDADAFLALRALRDEGRIQGVAVAARHPETAAEALAAADVEVPGVAGVVTALETLVRLLSQDRTVPASHP
jgi:trehalose 6-phosphate phosphatase